MANILPKSTYPSPAPSLIFFLCILSNSSVLIRSGSSFSSADFGDFFLIFTGGGEAFLLSFDLPSTRDDLLALFSSFSPTAASAPADETMGGGGGVGFLPIIPASISITFSMVFSLFWIWDWSEVGGREREEKKHVSVEIGTNGWGCVMLFQNLSFFAIKPSVGHFIF
jgi:hypothetical protein